MKTIISFDHISYSYHTTQGETPALCDISFEVHEGEFLSIVGPSGCGKTTLLSMTAGLCRPEAGQLRYPAAEAEGSMPPQTGYMLQHDELLEWRSIYHNVMLGLEIRHQCTDENRKKIEHLLRNYGLWDFRNSAPSELSGGMRQRAALIRTLVLEPQLLLLDEPFSALDYQTRLSVSSDIVAIIKKEHKTAILVTHDLSEAVSLSDRIVVLTKRPGTVSSIYDIHLTKTGSGPMASRRAPEFSGYFNQLWEELHENDTLREYD